MGLLSKLFGRKNDDGQAALARAIDRAREASSGAFEGDASLAKLDACFPDAANYEARLEVLNKLYELDRLDWADGFAKKLAHDPKCPQAITKGILKHFVAARRIAEIEAPLAAFVKARPTETELAVAIGARLIAAKRHEDCLDAIRPALAHNPDSMKLYAIAGECHAREKRWEDALNHLRTACEMYEQAFRRHQIPPDNLHGEQLEYSRLYAMLQEAARRHLGEEGMAAAFEGIHMAPSSFGLEREAEQLAATRVEYRPKHLAILPLGDIERLAAEAGARKEGEAEMRSLLALKALRERRFDAAMDLFRESLELDLDNFGAYFGWAACNTLANAETLPADDGRPDDATCERLCSVWNAMAPNERRVLRAALAPVAARLSLLAEAGARIAVHPLDVRLKDIFPAPVELRFENDGRPPQAIPAFAAKLEGHVRIDDFLAVTPQQFSAARVVGYLLADALREKDKAEYARAERLVAAAKSLVPAEQARTLGNVDELLAAACEAAALADLFGDAAQNDFAANLEKAGAIAFVRGK